MSWRTTFLLMLLLGYKYADAQQCMATPDANGHAIITDGTTTIPDNAFQYCTALKTVSIPTSVATIGSLAFLQCNSLISVTIPSSVTSIGASAFSGCTSLASVDIPAGITTIPDCAFQGCTALNTFSIPTTVTSIGSYAFQGCTSLTSVTIPKSVLIFGLEAFQDCSKLASVTISSSWTPKLVSGSTSIPGTSILSCARESRSPCVCSAGFGAQINGTMLTCSQCVGPYYTPGPGRTDCVTTPVPSMLPTPVPTAIPSAFPTYGSFHAQTLTASASVSFSAGRAVVSTLTRNPVVFTNLGSDTDYYLSISFAATGWSSNSGAFASLLVNKLVTYTCRPQNTCGLPGGPELSLCLNLVNIPIPKGQLSPENGGSISIQINIQNNNAIDPSTVCTFKGSNIYAKFTIQGSHGMPTPLPSSAPTYTPAPTYLFYMSTPPTAVPTSIPTSPTPAPSPFPTRGGAFQMSQVVAASKSPFPFVVFKGLSSSVTYYLTVGVYGTGFLGTNAVISVNLGVDGRSLIPSCDPGDTCSLGSPLMTVCLANIPIGAGDVSNDGTITLATSTSNFQTTHCAKDGHSVLVNFTLSSFPLATLSPTQAPTIAPSSAARSSLLQQQSESLGAVVTGTGALFYVIAAVSVIYSLLALLLVQIKQGNSKIYHLGLFGSIINMALVGSSFTSEMFLLQAVFTTPGCTELGAVLLVGRLLHLPATGYLLYCMFGDSKGATMSQQLDQDLILGSSKVFGALAVFAATDCTVARYFPWLSSPFSRKADGYPTGRVFLVCVCTKLLQSVITVTCQVSYFVIVNTAITADTQQAAQQLAFLVINMTTTAILVIVNGLEFVMKRSVLLGGTLSTVPDAMGLGGQSSPLPSLPAPRQRGSSGAASVLQRLSVAMRPSASVSGSGSVKDSIPSPMPEAVRNPLAAGSSVDIEMSDRVKTLEEHNAKMQEQNARLMAKMEEMLQRSEK